MEDILDKVSKIKQELYEKKKVSPFERGERVSVPERLVRSFSEKSEKNINVVILSVGTDDLVVQEQEYQTGKPVQIKKSDVVARDLYYVGANPFDEKFRNIQIVAFQLSSIIHNLNLGRTRREDDYVIGSVVVPEVNWNPYVYNSRGEKEYYQRDFCWSIHDKQLLIESIYNGIDCGKILVRLHSWQDIEKKANAGEQELGFRDIVDGKQRLNAIEEFILNYYPDLHGNYYADLSNRSQHLFGNHQLFGYAEMPESTTDEEVIYQFLKMNFTGVPQSKEHIDYVKEISKRL